MAKLIEFHIPQNFVKRTAKVTGKNCGKIIEFRKVDTNRASSEQPQAQPVEYQTGVRSLLSMVLYSGDYGE